MIPKERIKKISEDITLRIYLKVFHRIEYFLKQNEIPNKETIQLHSYVINPEKMPKKYSIKSQIFASSSSKKWKALIT